MVSVSRQMLGSRCRVNTRRWPTRKAGGERAIDAGTGELDNGRAPWGASRPDRGCEVQIQAARRYRLSAQAGLSCGSMPCWRSMARSRSTSSASCWHRSARSGRAGCPAAHCFLPLGLAGQQFLLPVTQRRGLLIVVSVDGGFLLATDLGDLLVQVSGVRPGTQPLLNGRQPALDRVQTDLHLGHRYALPGRLVTRRLLAADELDDLLPDPVQVGAQPDQHLRGHAVALADEAEQDVLGADVMAAQAISECCGARPPRGVAYPGGGCEVLIQPGRRYRALGQPVLSCGSMPCSRSRARSRSISSASCWTRSARSGSAECPATHCSCRAALAASNSFSRLRRAAACS